jgi:hypothetical protein
VQRTDVEHRGSGRHDATELLRSPFVEGADRGERSTKEGDSRTSAAGLMATPSSCPSISSGCRQGPYGESGRTRRTVASDFTCYLNA